MNGPKKALAKNKSGRKKKPATTRTDDRKRNAIVGVVEFHAPEIEPPARPIQPVIISRPDRQKAENAMSIEKLTKLIPPPAKPVDVPDEQRWASVEKKLGTKLPSDYLEFSSIYGTGMIADPGRLRLTVFNPCAKAYESQFKTHCDIFQESKEMEGDDYVPYDIFPNSPGLFPWASDDNGNTVFWLTKGPPDKWKTVFYPHSGYKQWFEYPESMTEFLLKAIQHTLDQLPWEDPFFTGPRSPVFVRHGDPFPSQ
jgi:hypothetical protein